VLFHFAPAHCFVHSFGIRLRMMSTKERVDLVMKNGDLRAGFFEQSIQITRPVPYISSTAIFIFARRMTSNFTSLWSCLK